MIQKLLKVTKLVILSTFIFSLMIQKSYGAGAYIHRKKEKQIELYKYQLVSIFMGYPYLSNGTRVVVVLSKNNTIEGESWVNKNLYISFRTLIREAQKDQNNYIIVDNQTDALRYVNKTFYAISILDDGIAIMRGKDVIKIKIKD